MAGSPIPNAPAAGGMPTAGGMRRMVETAGQRLREASGYVNGTTPQPGPMPAPATGLRGAAQTASNVAGKALRVGGGLAAAYQPAKETYDVARDNNTSKLDVATQAAEGTGKAASTWLGTTSGAALGAMTGPLAPVAIPVLATAGGVAGYYGADKAIKSLRGAFGMDERSPLERIHSAPQGVHSVPPTAQAAISAAKTAAQPAQPTLPSTDPRDAGPHPDLNGPLASVPKELPPGMSPGAVYKTRDANGLVTYSGRDVKEGATIANGMGAPVGRLDSGQYPGAPATGGMDALSREMTSLRDLGAARAAADPGWGGGAAGMGPSLRDIERKNAETTASSIDPRTARRGERQIDGMDKQDITTTQANAQRYGADAGLRGHMYAADQQLKGTLANANAQSLRTNMEMNMKFGQRQLMAQIYQKAGGDLAVAKKMALANGLDPQTFEQALAADQASTARTQDTQAQASDRVRADLKSFVADKDGKMAEDPSGSQAKFDAIRQVFPGITGTDPAYYDQHSSKIKSLAGIYDKARTMPKMGVDAINPFSTADTPLSSMPDWKGGTLTRASGLRGPLTPGIANGDYYMTTKDGRDIPLGQLDEAQVNLIREHTKTGKWHNK